MSYRPDHAPNHGPLDEPGGHGEAGGLVHCMVHIRREWERTLQENRKAASWFLSKIRELYHIEHECDKAGMNTEARRLERQMK